MSTEIVHLMELILVRGLHNKDIWEIRCICWTCWTKGWISLALRQNFTKVLYTSLFCTSSIAWNYIFINRSSCWQESKKSYILLSTGNYDYANQHGIFSHGEQDKLLVKVATMLTMFIILLNYSIIFDRREQEKLLSTNHAN